MIGKLKALVALRPRQLRPPLVETHRAKAIALAQIVVRKKQLSIALTPTESLLLAREFLLLLRERKPHDGRPWAT